MNSTASRNSIAAMFPVGEWVVLLLLAFALVPDAYAATLDRDAGDARIPRGSAKVIGRVTNNYQQPIVGADIVFKSLTRDYQTSSGPDGEYSIEVPGNASYDISFSADYHEPFMVTGSVIRGRRNPTVLDATLQAEAAVIVDAGFTGSADPGAQLQATGTYIILDGSSYLSSEWSQSGDGVPADISDPASDTTAVTLGSASEYAAYLIEVLTNPPITEDELPPDLELQPINEVKKGLQDRYQVVGIDPFAMEKAQHVPLAYNVTTSSGTYGADVEVATELPWVVSTGINTVPVNSSVLLYAKENGGYNWTLAAVPAGSSAALMDATTRNPWFTPDRVGTYQVIETNSAAVVEVHAGRYHGVIDPLLTLNSVEFGDGRPVGDDSCTACHTEGGAAPDTFATWRQTGHAEAFTQGITTNGHFSDHCFACHALGFDRPGAGGIDETPNYDAFLEMLADSQQNGTIADNWVNMLLNMPDTARMSNIQCENCHGPQDYTEAHQDQPGAPRVSLGSQVCGSCHGEPARHGRYQQWLVSNHADYDLARSRGDRENCGRCHSGNGFVAWGEHDFDPEQELAGEVTWNDDTVVPQVCVACHDPHDTGTTSGNDDTNAKVRVMGDTHMLTAGFIATGVGKGATCMTCHNSRADYPRNDATWAQVVANGDATDRPHHGVQADLIMGRNAYFMAPEELIRGKHSLIEDTCVTCHMNKTQPPDILSYNQAGTNHTFAADPNICADCHGDGVTADNVDAIITGYLDELAIELGAAYQRMIDAHYPVDIGGDCGPADGTTVWVSSIVWGGRSTRFDVTLSNGNACSRVDPSDVQVDDGEQTLYDVSLASNGGATLKAGWNWGLLNEDETVNECPDDDPSCVPPHTARGVHNPDFGIKVLTRAIAAVQAIEP